MRSSTVSLLERTYLILTPDNDIGHAGHETADYAAAALPGVVRDALARVLDAAPGVEPDPAAVEAALQSAIADFDASLGKGVLALFPDAGALADMDEAAVHAVVAADGPEAKAVVLRAMRGSTALIAVTDPTRANLWVASLGDCAAGTHIFQFTVHNTCLIESPLFQYSGHGLKVVSGQQSY